MARKKVRTGFLIFNKKKTWSGKKVRTVFLLFKKKSKGKEKGKSPILTFEKKNTL